MSVDRDPREGDVYRWADHNFRCVVDAVTPRGAVVYYTADGNGPFVTTVDYWREYATLIVPRPKVADCWGYLCRGRFTTQLGGGEHGAREAVAKYPNTFTLARVIDGRVCDEHGEPFETAT